MSILMVLALAQGEFAKTTHVYKTVGETKVHLDVYRKAAADAPSVLVWIHGGALIMGDRNGVPGDLRKLCADEGYTLVSIDYRLAPGSKVPAIIEDLKDAFRWVRENLKPGKLVVAGGSAGGYLTLMSGFAVEPRPTALVAYWGYGDVDGDWYTKPSDFYRKSQPLYSREEATKGLSDSVATGPASPDDAKARGRYYHFLRQNGLWTKEVTGFDPETERAKLDPYCPVRNVTPAWPPTLLVHGTDDTDVPYDRSELMARELARHKVEHELVTVPAAGHGLAGGDKKLVADAREKALAFIRRYLR